MRGKFMLRNRQDWVKTGRGAKTRLRTKSHRSKQTEGERRIYTVGGTGDFPEKLTHLEKTRGKKKNENAG